MSMTHSGLSLQADEAVGEASASASVLVTSTVTPLAYSGCRQGR